MSLDIYVQCSHCGYTEDVNLTHNLRPMAGQLGIKNLLWRDGPFPPRELIEPVKNALIDLEERPEHYRQFQGPNSLGTVEWMTEVLEKLLGACEAAPDGEVTTTW